MSKTLRVLLVEDSPDDAELLVLQLEREQYTVISERVETADEMSAALDRQSWDVILSDYSMPSFDALAALKLMKAKGLDLPFIIVSGVIGEEIAVAAMQAGAHDYLLKKHLTRLAPAIERELREAQVRAQYEQAMAEIKTLAFYDTLTGLPNQTQFLRNLQTWINTAPPSELFGIVFLDIERYKSVKYAFGHTKSEQFLIEVARRLKTWIQPNDCLAKVGEDSFALLLTGLHNQDELEQRVEQIHQLMQETFQVGQSRIYASVNLGVVDSTNPYTSPEDLLRAADTAMSSAKQQTSRTVFSNTQMQAEELQRLQIEADLQQAIPLQQLQLHYQPIVALATNRVIGFEALLRWEHPMHGWISPGTFIPLAEQTGLIIALGKWVLLEVCRQMGQWQGSLVNYFPLTVAVNLSGIQLNQPGLAGSIQQLYQSFCSENVRFSVEITESALMTKPETALETLEQLRAAGIEISVDDFGTGYSSLAYLHRLPIDTLKIDRSFIHEITNNSKSLDVVKTIISLAHTMNLAVVAEGIETEAQKEILQALSCQYGQGYLFSKPLAPSMIPNWMQSYAQQTHHSNNCSVSVGRSEFNRQQP
jgi:diguanylate cyclase (GGDEF)-like protein